MTIRRRLFWSNILMIAVPACLTALVGLLCMGMVWLVMQGGSGLGMEHSAEFYHMGKIAAETVASAAETGEENLSARLEGLTSLLDQGTMRLAVEEDGQPIYAYGASSAEDAALLKAAETLGGGTAEISSGGRALYRTELTASGRTVTVYLFGTMGEEHFSQGLRMAIGLAAVLVLAAVVGSILLTNRFLTRFVFRRIKEPLELLASSARQLGEGELSTRISYTGKDEFAPVCAAFNEMAAHLQGTIAQSCREEESRKELLAGISHDLRSPLTSIQAYVEGLLDGVARTLAMQQKYLQTIREKTKDIDRLVSQLFLFSELDLENYPLLMRPLELSVWLPKTVEEVREDYRRQGLEVRVRTVPALVRADPEQLRRVLVNLLDNSAKYKERPEGTVEISVATGEREVLLQVADDGPGVPEEALPKLFDAFYRSDPARKNPAGGSGLGLAIAAKAVENMGGSIRAYNVPAGGLTIAITLPREAEGNAENPDY